jgi:ribosomal protein S18 acetylase RimI-like enzyme
MVLEMKDIFIRKAKRDDLQEIISIFKMATEVMNENNILQWDDLYPDVNILEEDINKNQMYVGIINNEIVSAFVLNQDCDEQYGNGDWEYPDCSYSVIHRLCVSPLYQNQGIGTKIICLIETMLKDSCIETVRLDAFSLNPYALKMYEKLGYRKVGEVTWRKGLFYIYEKILF